LGAAWQMNMILLHSNHCHLDRKAFRNLGRRLLAVDWLNQNDNIVKLAKEVGIP
jgi:hypothetical protein